MFQTYVLEYERKLLWCSKCKLCSELAMLLLYLANKAILEHLTVFFKAVVAWAQ